MKRASSGVAEVLDVTGDTATVYRSDLTAPRVLLVAEYRAGDRAVYLSFTLARARRLAAVLLKAAAPAPKKRVRR